MVKTDQYIKIIIVIVILISLSISGYIIYKNNITPTTVTPHTSLSLIQTKLASTNAPSSAPTITPSLASIIDPLLSIITPLSSLAPMIAPAILATPALETLTTPALETATPALETLTTPALETLTTPALATATPALATATPALATATAVTPIATATLVTPLATAVTPLGSSTPVLATATPALATAVTPLGSSTPVLATATAVTPLGSATLNQSAQILIRENVYLIDSVTNKYCTIDSNNNLICNINNKKDAKLFEISNNVNSNYNEYYIKVDGNNIKIKYNYNSNDNYLSIYKSNIPNHIYISNFISPPMPEYNRYSNYDYNMYCSVNPNNYVDCGYKKMDIKSFKIETENNNLFNSLEYLPDYELKGCYNDLPSDRELSKFIKRGTISECETFAKENNYKLYGLQNFNDNDGKADCMVSSNINLDKYGKYGVSSNHKIIKNLMYGNTNSNCVYGTNETNKVESNNIMCYDKNDNIIIVPKNDRFEKCKISCLKKDDNIYDRDIFNNNILDYKINTVTNPDGSSETHYKRVINDKIYNDNNFISGIYNDIKSECKRFLNPYTQALQCYKDNDTSKGDTNLINIDKNNLLRDLYFCTGFKLKCKDANNNEIIYDSNMMYSPGTPSFTDTCKYIYNNKTNEYIDKIRNNNDYINSIIPKDTKITIKKMGWSASPSPANNIITMDLKNNDTVGSLLICKNPMKKIPENISGNEVDNYSKRLIGEINSNNKLFTTGIYGNNSCDL